MWTRPIGQVYFLAAKSADVPYGLQLYRVPLSGEGEPELLTSGKGRIEVAMAPMDSILSAGNLHRRKRRWFACAEPVGNWCGSWGGLTKLSCRSAGFGGVESVMLKDTSGRWLQAVTIMRPYHFDPEQSYPVIEHIYGGMQSIHTRHGYYGFGAGRVDDVTRMLLRAGYVVVRVDAPGTPGRGRDSRMRSMPVGRRR